MYHITGATMSIACMCMYIGLAADKSVLVADVAKADNTQMLSMCLVGLMLIPTVIAKAFNWRKAR